MTREHKFRAWDKDNKEIIEIKQISFGMSPWIMDNGEICTNFELMQSTGLLDKNGKEIYEGDIVRLDGGNLPKEACSVGVVVFLPTEGYYADLGKDCRGDLLDCEIIGDKYQNPELCKN